MKHSLKLLILLSLGSGCQPNIDLEKPTASSYREDVHNLAFKLGNSFWSNGGQNCNMTGCVSNQVFAYLGKRTNGAFELNLSGAYTAPNLEQVFYLYAEDIHALGLYELSDHSGMKFIENYTSQTYRLYQSEPYHKCQVEIIKLDTIQHIIAGKFHGVLFNPSNLNDSLVITSGRFETKLVQ